MAFYLIEFFTETGTVASVSQEANSREEAISLCGLAPSTIHKASEDHLGSLKALMVKRFTPVQQALILSTLSSKVASNKTFGQAVLEAVPYEEIGVTKAQVEACSNPKQYLTLLRFDETVILLAEAGDRVAKLPDSLSQASDALYDRIRAKKDFGKALRQGYLYSGLGIVCFIATPLFGGGMLNEMQEKQHIALQLNFCSKILLSLREVYANFWWVFLLVAACAFVFRKPAWQWAKQLPFLSVIDKRTKVGRALSFVLSFRLLLSSGLNNPQSFDFIAKSSTGRNYEIFKSAAVSLEKGDELSEVLHEDDWPILLKQNLQDFEDLAGPERDKVLSHLIKALKSYFLDYSERISRVISTVGQAMIVMAILFYVAGFYLPLMSISQGLK